MSDIKYKTVVQAIANNLERYREMSNRDTRIWTAQEQEAVMKYEQQIAPASIALLLKILGSVRAAAMCHVRSEQVGADEAEKQFDQEVESLVYAVVDVKPL